MKNKKLQFKAETVVSISAMLIAAASIFVAVWQGMEIRAHNRLSVRPRLQILFSVDKNYFGYTLVNNGLGPAIIAGKRIWVDGEEIGYQGFSGYEDFISKLGLQGREGAQGAVSRGTSIASGETRKIILFAYGRDEDVDAFVPGIYSRVRMEIDYESMYNESFKCFVPSENR